VANPQKENGHLGIANEIVEKLARTPFSGSEFRVILSVLRKTWGWHKKKDRISLTQMKKATELPRRSVRRTRDGLIEQNVLIKNPDGVKIAHRSINFYMFNKDYETWRLRVKSAHGVKNAQRTMRKNAHHKRKERHLNLSSDFFSLVDLLSEKMLENDRKAKVPKTEVQRSNWASSFRLLIEKDGREIEEVKKVLIWCQQDSFWKPNILSASKFRERYAQLKLKMEEVQKRPGPQKLTREEFNRMQEEALKRR
jgi:phage replication O-like protein O